MGSRVRGHDVRKVSPRKKKIVFSSIPDSCEMGCDKWLILLYIYIIML